MFAPLADFIADKLSAKFNITEPIGIKYVITCIVHAILVIIINRLPKIGFIPVSGFLLFLYCGGVIALWICTGHWAVVDGNFLDIINSHSLHSQLRTYTTLPNYRVTCLHFTFNITTTNELFYVYRVEFNTNVLFTLFRYSMVFGSYTIVCIKAS